MKLAKEVISVGKRRLDEGYAVYLEKGVDRIGIIQLYGDSDMYRQDLQKDYEDLCDMEDIAQSLELLFSNLILSLKLTEDRFNSAMSLYGVFISSHLTWEEVITFVRRHENRL